MNTQEIKILYLDDEDLIPGLNPQHPACYIQEATTAMLDHQMVIYVGKSGTHILKDRTGIAANLQSSATDANSKRAKLQARLNSIQQILNAE